MPIKINGTNTAANPSITGTDTDTGIVYGSDQIDFSIGGTSKLTLDSSGHLGIGLTSPARQLHIVGNDGATGATPGNSDTALIIDNQGTNGAIMEFLSDTNGNGYIFFTDTDASNRGAIRYKHSDDSLAFHTAATERMKISSDGVTDFVSTSHVINATTSQAAGGSSHYCYRGHHSSGTISFNVWSNGNVQNTNNSYSSISDVKLKENIVDANSQWSDIKALKIRNYNFKAETKHETHTQIGVVAQELETVCPKLVTEITDVDSDGKDLGTTTKTVNYSVLYMKSIKCLQEAMAKIETLETKVAALEAA